MSFGDGRVSIVDRCRARPAHRHGGAARAGAGRGGGGGFTLVEMLLSISIVGVLGVAMVAAIDASLMAYGTSSESASMQTSGRLIMQRTMAMIRNASLHDAHDPADAGKTLVLPSDVNHPVRSVGIQMVNDAGHTVRIWWAVNDAYQDADLGDLWYEQDGGTPQSLVERVRCQRDASDDPYVFTLASRTSDAGLLLARATLDLALQRNPDSATDLEAAAGKLGELRLVRSTMPRRHLD